MSVRRTFPMPLSQQIAIVATGVIGNAPSGVTLANLPNKDNFFKGITDFISNPQLWFNVIGVIIALILIIIGLNVIVRKGV